MEGDNDLQQIVEAKGKKTKKNTETTELWGVINLVISKNFGPCISFSFSKAECENYAWILSKCEYTNDEEKETIKQVFNNAI